ncbi:MAG: glucosyl transferase, partial [Melioribacteraceae bacterium]|nr:glucosyl transferase [Melioribacteraceae bacterium]
DFVWETFTFGEHSSSSLYDVAIIDENNIWAVGEIYLKDSTGKPEPHYYNLAKWDGSTWHLSRVYYYDFDGVAFLSHLKSIYAFNKDDIWLGGANRWNGKDYVSIPLNISFPYQIFEMWGTSSSNFYIVGDGGSIARYNGKYWERIDSGTDWKIYDIYGFTNPMNNDTEMLCAATDDNNYANSAILKITEKSKVERINLSTQRLAGSAWTNKGFPIYITGDGVFSNRMGKWEEIKLPVNYVTSMIRGNGLNDIILCGGWGLIAHNNGKDWKVYSGIYNASYSTINIKNNVAVAVGLRDAKAVVTIGRRK